jgi:hypothetical protein
MRKSVLLPFGSFFLAGLLLCLTGCTRHEVDLKPVEIKPIHITIDINVKVDRALDDFFSDLDAAPKK